MERGQRGMMKKDNQEVTSLQGLINKKMLLYNQVCCCYLIFFLQAEGFQSDCFLRPVKWDDSQSHKGQRFFVPHKLRHLDYGSQNILLHSLIQSPQTPLVSVTFQVLSAGFKTSIASAITKVYSALDLSFCFNGL